MPLVLALLAASLVQEPATAAKKLLDAVAEKLKDSETIAFEVEQTFQPPGQDQVPSEAAG